MFKVSHVELRIRKISFEKFKPWYVRINTIWNTCCCRYNIEFDLYYHTFAHIRHFLHPNHVQECSSTIPPMSSRDFIHSITCLRQDGKTHYLNKMCRRFLQQLRWAILMVWLHPWKWRSSIRECNCWEEELSVWDISAKRWERKQED